MRRHRSGIGVVLFHIALVLILGTSVRHWVICRRLAVFHAEHEQSHLEAAAFGGPGAHLAQEAAEVEARLRRACEKCAWRPWEAIPTYPTIH